MLSTTSIRRLPPRAALLLLVTACAGPAKSPPDATTDAIAVEVAVISDMTARPTVTATGRYAPRDEIPLAFKTGGVIARVLVDDGQRVQRGQLLAALDLREIDAMVAKAQAAMDKAQRDRDRVARLAADSVATLTQLQDAETGLAAARADLAQAQINREYSVISAPEAGVIQRRLLVAGTLASPGMPVLMLGGSRRGAVVRAGLSDRDVVRVRVGDSATAMFSALPSQRFSGRVTLVGQAADAQTGTYPVEVALQGAGTLPLGLIGEVRITTAPPPGRASNGRMQNTTGGAIPMTALLESDGDSATVLTLASARDSVPVRRRVRVAGLTADMALVDGLAMGTLVVARGAAFVTPGAMVRVQGDGVQPLRVPERVSDRVPQPEARP
jgi:multidrug efflux system membrane fusion protein